MVKHKLPIKQELTKYLGRRQFQPVGRSVKILHGLECRSSGAVWRRQLERCRVEEGGPENIVCPVSNVQCPVAVCLENTVCPLLGHTMDTRGVSSQCLFWPAEVALVIRSSHRW